VSKLTALGMTLSVDNSAGSAVNITNDVGNFTINEGRTVIDVSGLDVVGMERLLGRSDISVELTGFYNPALSHTVFSDVGTQAGTVTRTVAIAFSSGTATAEMVAASYNHTIGNDGSHGWTASLQGTGGSAAAWT